MLLLYPSNNQPLSLREHILVYYKSVRFELHYDYSFLKSKYHLISFF
jgi:hypothetical protein